MQPIKIVRENECELALFMPTRGLEIDTPITLALLHADGSVKATISMTVDDFMRYANIVTEELVNEQ